MNTVPEKIEQMANMYAQKIYDLFKQSDFMDLIREIAAQVSHRTKMAVGVSIIPSDALVFTDGSFYLQVAFHLVPMVDELINSGNTDYSLGTVIISFQGTISEDVDALLIRAKEKFSNQLKLLFRNIINKNLDLELAKSIALRNPSIVQKARSLYEKYGKQMKSA